MLLSNFCFGSHQKWFGAVRCGIMCEISCEIRILYSRKIWQRIKFGSLVVCLCNRQIKIHQNFLLAYICMEIPYRTAKLKFANIFVHAGWGQSAKFNSRQFFRLYGIYNNIPRGYAFIVAWDWSRWLSNFLIINRTTSCRLYHLTALRLNKSLVVWTWQKLKKTTYSSALNSIYRSFSSKRCWLLNPL